ncbi:molybdate ABC transporter substrate-binding protein [Litorivivens lipolytica]
MRRFRNVFLLCWLLGNLPASLAGETLLVAVASNFMGPMREIGAAFERETGHRVTLASGSSGKLYAQIRYGAPFDVFLSADREKPQALIDAGHALPDSRITYALGTLVLWSPGADDPLALLNTDFNRLALANPRLAPYGQAAEATLDKLNLLNATRPRWVQGENIAQAFQFVASGNAQLGFVALSQLREHPVSGGLWEVPAELHPPIRQDGVILNRSKNINISKALIGFFNSDSVREILSRYGYRQPESG